MTIERIQLRRGTAAQWTDTDPILGAGEVGVELAIPNKFKIGDGSSLWSELEYFTTASQSSNIPLSQKGAANGVATLDANGAIPTGQLANIIDSAPTTLDTLNELAAALADDANFAATITAELGNKADLSHTHNFGAVIYSVNDKSSNYAILAADKGRLIRSTGSAITITIDDVLATGEAITFAQFGSGQITFLAGSGVTINSKSGHLKTASQYSVATIVKVAAATYWLFGDLSA